ncbi:MAG TPA: GNAT family N-acetyltransferase [Bacillales bacterium]|nr:GNAT family N-acetyltransferase [Bacillales bacterium]
MKVIETERLAIRWLSTDDAAFIMELLNTPSWIRFIGDRGIRTIGDARNYIVGGPMDMYAKLGFGLYAVELKDSLTPIGICGLIKRDSLDDVDIGYAFLPSFWGQGYAYEAARAVVHYGRKQLKLDRIIAITTIDNLSSINLLEKLGFQFERMVQFDNEELKLYANVIK